MSRKYSLIRQVVDFIQYSQPGSGPVWITPPDTDVIAELTCLEDGESPRPEDVLRITKRLESLGLIERLEPTGDSLGPRYRMAENRIGSGGKERF